MRRLLLLVTVCSLCSLVRFSSAATSKSKGKAKPAAKAKAEPKPEPNVIQPEAKALLESAAKKYDDATSMHLEMKIEMKVQMKGMAAPPMPAMTMMMDTQKPNKSRTVMSGFGMPGGEAKPNISVHDGEKTWTYLGMLNQYTETKSAAGVSTPLTDPLAFSGSPMGTGDWTKWLAGLRHAVLANSPEMVGENSCRVVNARASMADIMPKDSKLPEAAPQAVRDMFKLPMKMTFFVDSDLMIRKIEMDMTDMVKEMAKSAGPAAGGPAFEKMTTTMLYTKVDLNPKLPDDAFKFTPPEGAKKVDAFQFGGPQGAGGQAESSLEGKPAPDFTLKSTDGRTVKLSGLRGKPVFINFYAEF